MFCVFPFVDPVVRSKRAICLQVRSGVMEFDRRAFTRYIEAQGLMFKKTAYAMVGFF